MLHPTIHHVLEHANLISAWEKVRANKGCAGTDGVTIEEFGARLEDNLNQLKREVLDRSYRPRPLLRIDIPKKDGKFRSLSIPTVRDRVLQTAVAKVLEPVFEEEFEDCSFAYRRGRSVDMAVQRVIALREMGYNWVVDIDIHAFFDQIDHGILLQEVERLVKDREILDLIRMWIQAQVQEGERVFRLEKGVPQGSPISPLLANLYLDRLDEELLDENLKIIRFADDFLVLCKKRERAQDAMELTQDVLNALKLTVNREKSAVTTFDVGFRFLGVQFIRGLAFRIKNDKKGKGAGQEISGAPQVKQACSAPCRNATEIAPGPKGPGPRLEPPTSEPVPAGHDPRLRTLYIMKHGCVLGKESERFTVREKAKVLVEVPAIKVDQIMVYGNAQITTQAMHFCLMEKIPVFLLSSKGRYFGVVDSLDTDPVFLHKVQFERADDKTFCLELARAFIHGKIANSRVVLHRFSRKRNAPVLREAFEKLRSSIRRLKQAASLEEIYGIEGSAARIYFGSIARTLAPEWGFEKRRKRPSKDPVNSLLSYGYTLLFYNIYSIARARGLNPHVGYLHPIRSGHPALVSDIIEEFRAITVDSVVLALLLNRRLSPVGFSKDSTGRCIIGQKARDLFLRAFENKMNSAITHPSTGLKLDYRRCIEHQVNLLARVIRGVEERYVPMVVR